MKMSSPRVTGDSAFLSCPWSLKDVFLAIVYAIALFFVLYFWIAALYFLIGVFEGFTYKEMESFLLTLKTTQPFAPVIVFYIALWWAMYAKIFNKYHVRPVDFFVNKERLKHDIVYGVAMYLKFVTAIAATVVLLVFVAQMIEIVFGMAILSQIEAFFLAGELEQLEVSGMVKGSVGIAILLILAPFIEEVLFRGCFYTALRVHVGRWAAILITSTIFAFLHGYLFLFFYIFFIGVVLSHMYESRASLVSPLIFHMLNNLTALIFIFSRVVL